MEARNVILPLRKVSSCTYAFLELETAQPTQFHPKSKISWAIICGNPAAVVAHKQKRYLQIEIQSLRLRRNLRLASHGFGIGLFNLSDYSSNSTGPSLETIFLCVTKTSFSQFHKHKIGNTRSQTTP
jgi:hypothetical protein